MRILFAADGSEGSLGAACFLSGLGHHPNVHVHVVTALPHDETDDDSIVLQVAREALGGFAGQITGETFRADSTSEIVDGVLSAAGFTDAEMIVVGARGKSAMTRFLLGSVAESVARHATVPVLVARPMNAPSLAPPDTETRLRSVLVGVDGSKSSHDAALFAASSFPLPPDCKIRLESVVQHPRWAAYPSLLAVQGVGTLVEEAEAANKAHAEAVLSGLQRELASRGIPVDAEMVYGEPAARLGGLAATHQAGLIVVGSRGVGGLESFLMGSVSGRLLWNAPCSVLVYKQPPTL